MRSVPRFYVRPDLLKSTHTGLLFTHWIADSLTLWRAPVTDAHLWVAARYYHVLTKGAPGVGYVVAVTATLGALTILWSFRDGQADNLMFDGGSICKTLFFSSKFRVVVLNPSSKKSYMAPRYRFMSKPCFRVCMFAEN